MKLIIVRHGQTYFNLNKRTQGWCDSPLTELGIQQACNAGRLLKNEKIDFIISSPSGRTIETLSHIVDINNCKYTTDTRLKEMNYGWFESRWDLLKNVFTILRMKQDYRLVGGESINDTITRFELCIEELYKNHPDDTVLVISHGGVMSKFIIKNCIKQILNEFNTFTFCKNAAINILEYDGSKYNIVVLNKVK